MDTFANKAWLVELIYRRAGPNGRRPPSRFYVSGWDRPSQVIAAVRTASGGSDDVIVFCRRELSQDEIIAHKLITQQTKELPNGSDVRPDNARSPAFEASGGEHSSSPKQEHQPIQQTTAPENEKPKTEVRSVFWGWWPYKP
jgi:hypothetical protein